MPEPKVIKFGFKELATLMIREQQIHEGHWGVYVRFGLSAINSGPSPESVFPTAMVPVMEIGLTEFEGPGPLSVDAATVWTK